MGAFLLSDVESRLARDVEEGSVCDFSLTEAERPVIRAEVIRRLLLGLTVTLTGEEHCGKELTRVIKAPGTGIYLAFARIEGALKLNDAGDVGGGALQALALKRCVIPDDLMLSRARFRSLSFADSNLTHLLARDLHIEGSLDISGVSSADVSGTGANGEGQCCIELHRAEIHGGIDANNSHFVAHKPPEVADPNVSPNYAFNIRSAHIRDSVLLDPGVSAIGGVCMEDAIIGGDVRAGNGTFVAVEEHAFDAEAARIEGHLYLNRSNFSSDHARAGRIKGDLRLLGVRIDGDLRMNNTAIRGNIILAKARIGARLTLRNVAISRKDGRDPTRVAEKLNWLAGRLLRPFLRRCYPGDPIVEFTDAKVGVLDDNDGRGISGRFRLQVEGFEYARIMTTQLGGARCRTPRDIREALDLGVMAWTVTRCAAWTLFFVVLLRYAQQCLHVKLGKWLPPLSNIPWPEPVHGTAGVVIAVICIAIAVASVYLAASDFRIFRPHWRARRDWLDKQYTYLWSVRNGREYDPSPYEHLSRVLRSQGLFEDARKIASIRLTLERKLRTQAIFRPALFLFRHCFDYGLSSCRALLTFAACITIGAISIGMADYGFHPQKLPLLTVAQSKPYLSLLPQFEPVLIIHANAVNTLISTEPSGQKLPAFDGIQTVENLSEEHMPCGHQIEPLLYAIDIFIPALDLQQETRCIISTRPDAFPWRVAKVLYALLGWIVVSLMLLTISGVLRRQAEA